MWTVKPLFIITLSMFVSESRQNSTEESNCKILHPLMYAIICFLAFMVFVLMMLLMRMFMSMQKSFNSAIRRDTVQVTSTNEESITMHQNNAPTSLISANGGDNSSTTSSEGPVCSLADLSSGSQRYVSLQDCQKTSDYINVTESTSAGRMDCKSKTANINYGNVKEPRRKKMNNRKGQDQRDDGTTSMSSDDSEDSALNYSKVVFITNKS